MATDEIRLLAGDCTVQYESNGHEGREKRGAVIVLAKPDGTVLVHDCDGYRPAAWLTRAEAVSYEADGAGVSIRARGDGARLSVACHEVFGEGRYPASDTGAPVGTCPDCGGTLVGVTGAVTCLGCDARYGIPRDATVTDDTCPDCGLPLMTIERGAGFRLCVDRSCSSLDDAVRERFDRAWNCPACGGALQILRRGSLIAGCERYPECDVGYAVPNGTVDGTCGCGLPRFETADGSRYLDASCSVEA